MNWKRALAITGKRILPGAAGAVALLGVLAYMTGLFSEKIAPTEAAPPARKASPSEIASAYVVHEVSRPMVEEAIGTLRAAHRTEISPRVMAAIEAIHVRAGDFVEAGQELVTLDRRALETQRSQVEANLVAAEASLKSAETDFARGERLIEGQTISQEQFDQLTRNVAVARANHRHAREALAEAEVMLTYTTISAPRSGMIVDRLAEEGDMARPGGPLLVLYDPGTLRLEVPVGENLVGQVRVGDELEVFIDARNQTYHGVVDEIVPQAEAATRSFLVKVALPPSDDTFEGMFGRLRIPTGERQYVCLHTGTIERIGQLELVDVIREDGTFERRFITTGRRGDERMGDAYHVEVLSGLAPGERVLMRSARS